MQRELPKETHATLRLQLRPRPLKLRLTGFLCSSASATSELLNGKSDSAHACRLFLFAAALVRSNAELIDAARRLPEMASTLIRLKAQPQPPAEPVGCSALLGGSLCITGVDPDFTVLRSIFPARE